MSVLPEGFTSVRALVQARMDDLSNGERKVARALVSAYPSAALTTVADLATAAGVSAPTVVRFVTRLGLAGFPALQRALVDELGEGGSPLRQYDAKAVADSQGILEHTRHTFLAMVEESYAELPASEFDKLVDLLSDRTRPVVLVGGRFSGLLADYLALHLRMLRPGVQVVGLEPTERQIALVDAGPATVLLVFDYRRYTPEQLRFARAMKDRGARVALMTDNWLSPVAKLAQVVLPTRVDSASPFDSLVPALAVVESVVAAVVDRLGGDGRARVEATEAALPD